MPFVVADGWAIEVSGTTADALFDAGLTLYGTLAGAVMYGGVRATAFDQPVRATPVYPAAEALALWPVLPPSCGMVADYKVVTTSG